MSEPLVSWCFIGVVVIALWVSHGLIFFVRFWPSKITHRQSVGHVDFRPETDRIAGWKACWWWWHTAAWMNPIRLGRGDELRPGFVVIFSATALMLSWIGGIHVDSQNNSSMYLVKASLSFLSAISWAPTACSVTSWCLSSHNCSVKQLGYKLVPFS